MLKNLDETRPLKGLLYLTTSDKSALVSILPRALALTHQGGGSQSRCCPQLGRGQRTSFARRQGRHACKHQQDTTHPP